MKHPTKADILIKTHHHPTDSTTGGLFELVQENDDNGNPLAVSVFRLHAREPWGRYEAKGNESPWDVAIKHIVYRLESGDLHADRYDPAPLWVFLNRHAAYVVGFLADEQRDYLTCVSEWDNDTMDWRRSHPAFTPFRAGERPLHYSVAWQRGWAHDIESAARHILELRGVPNTWDEDAEHYLHDVCMVAAQWGDRDECSRKHIVYGVEALMAGRRWFEGEDYNTPGGLVGIDDEATEALRMAWENLEQHLSEEVANA
jgi:hypothetical protein